jgi:osmotically-inducible protein OsmY
MADKGIDASHIDVDTDAGTRTVSLKGTVPTAAQKAAAEKVARDKAEGYSVRNLLTVPKS